MIIIDTDELAPAKAETNADRRRRTARAHIQTVPTQMGEESTYAELVVRHDRDSASYRAELSHHIELKKPSGRTSILFKLNGPSVATLMKVPTGRYSAARLDGLYEDAHARLLELVEDRQEQIIPLLSQQG